VRPVVFLGDSLDAIRQFPTGARREAGFQIDRLQRGLDPDDWKPMASLGAGAREIRIRDRTGAFRVIYVTGFTDGIVVLHAFQKKTARTPKRDIDLAASRLKERLRRRPR
jgi:phage-related protein